jgi:sensor domain CHASE-containing protein
MGQHRSATGPVASKLLLAVFLISLTSTLICWRLAASNERGHIQRMTHLAASAVAADLRSDMDAWLLGQVRLAKMWEIDEPNYDQWMAFASLYVEHHPGCVAIEWLDPKYEERWIARSPGETSPLPGNGMRERLLQSALQSKEPVLSNLFNAPDGR